MKKKLKLIMIIPLILISAYLIDLNNIFLPILIILFLLCCYISKKLYPDSWKITKEDMEHRLKYGGRVLHEPTPYVYKKGLTYIVGADCYKDDCGNYYDHKNAKIAPPVQIIQK